MEVIKIKRKTSLKHDQVEQLQLEKVIGLSPPSSHTLSHNPAREGVIAYSAGSVVVIYDIISRHQIKYLQSQGNGKLINCTAFTKDGRFLAAGEKGHAPCILVWEVDSGRCIHQLKGHKYGVASLAFSSDGKYLVSSGVAYDGQICIWDWQGGINMCRHYAGAEIHAVAFSEDASSLISVGKEHLKAWSISGSGPASRLRPSALQLQPRPVNLKDFKAATFADVRHSAAGGFYAITSAGILALMKPSLRGVDKSVNLQVRAAFALATSSSTIACACAAGTVRLFALKTLAFVANLPRIAPRGQDQPQGKVAGAAVQLSQDIFPDALGCSFDASGKRLAVAYSDRSLHIWDVSNTAQPAVRIRSLSAHAASVWDVIPLPSQTQLAASTVSSFGAAAASLFATCSSDGSIRLWNIADVAAGRAGAEDAAGGGKGSRTLAGIVYASSNDGKRAAKQASKRWDPESSPLPQPGESRTAAAKEQQVLLRCVRLSPDGSQLAAGDQKGNLRVYDLRSMTLITFKEAHDAEILTLDYCRAAGGGLLLASGSRDTLIHVFDVQRGYEVVQTLDEHTASVTAVRFAPGGVRLISCSADRSIVFRCAEVLGGAGYSPYKQYHKEQLPRSLLYDLAVDPAGRHAISAGQDGYLRLWDLATGRQARALQPEPSAGEPVRVTVDAGGLYAICANADGCSRVYELATGALLCKAAGHGELATAAVMSPDGCHLVSVSGDGCLCVWQLPPQLAADSRAAAETLQQLQQQQVDSDTPDAQRKAAWQSSADDSPLVSTTLLRVQQGMPLVSTEKLPKWAVQAARAAAPQQQQQPLAEVRSWEEAGEEQPQAAAQQQQAWLPAAAGNWTQQGGVSSDQAQGGGPATDQQQQQQVLSPSGQGPKRMWQDLAPVQDTQQQQQLLSPTGHAPKHTWQDSATTQDTQQQLQQQLLFSPKRQVPSRTWQDSLDDDDEIVYFSSAADELAVEAYDVNDTTEDFDHAMQREAAAAAAAAEEVPEEDFPAPTLSAEPSVDEARRDLFRQHFDTLDGAAAAAAAAAQEDAARQSLSTRFKAERASIVALPKQQQQQQQEEAASSPAAAAAAGGTLFAAPAAAPAELLAGNLSAAPDSSPAAASSPTRVKRNKFIQPREQPPQLFRSTSEPLLDMGNGHRPSSDCENGEARQWRRGQMDTALQRMRSQLDDLHQQFKAQLGAKPHGSPVARRQLRSAPASPPNSSSPRRSEGDQEQGESAAGCRPEQLQVCAAEAAAAAAAAAVPAAAAARPPLPPGPPPTWSITKLPSPPTATAPAPAPAPPSAAAAAAAGPGLQLDAITFSMTDSVLLGSPDPSYIVTTSMILPATAAAPAAVPQPQQQLLEQPVSRPAAPPPPSSPPAAAAAAPTATAPSSSSFITPEAHHRPPDTLQDSWPAFDAITPPSISPMEGVTTYNHAPHEPMLIGTPLQAKSVWVHSPEQHQQQQQQEGGAMWFSNAVAGSPMSISPGIQQQQQQQQQESPSISTSAGPKSGSKAPGSPSSGMMGLLQRMKASMAGKKKSNKYAAAAAAAAAAEAEAVQAHRAASSSRSSEDGASTEAAAAAAAPRRTSSSGQVSRVVAALEHQQLPQAKQQQQTANGYRAAAAAPLEEVVLQAMPGMSAAQQQQQQQQQQDSAPIELTSAPPAHEEMQLDGASPADQQQQQQQQDYPELPLSSQPVDSLTNPTEQQQQQPPASSPPSAAAAAAGQPPLPHSVEHYTAALQRFRGAVSEMQQLWGELSSSSSDSVAEQAAPASIAPAAADGSTDSLRSSIAVTGLRQQFQQEVMRSIGDLHAVLAAAAAAPPAPNPSPQQAPVPTHPSPPFHHHTIYPTPAAAGPAWLPHQPPQQQQPPSYAAGVSPLLGPNNPLYLRSPTASMASETVSLQSSAAVEDICQQYSDMLISKMEERLMDRLAARLAAAAGVGGGGGSSGGGSRAGAAAGQLQSRRGTQS